MARAAGVSIATVSRVLNGAPRVSPVTRARVMDAAAALSYRPNTIARSLATRRSYALGLILPDIMNPFFPSLVRELQIATDARGYTLVLCQSFGRAEHESRYLATLSQSRVDGLILIGISLSERQFERILDPGLPVVCLDRPIALPRATLVQVDNYQAGRIATTHLLETGRRVLAHLGGEPPLQPARARQQGFIDTCREAGLPTHRRRVERGDLTVEGGFRAMERLLERGPVPTGIFAANDLMAVGALAALRQSKLSVPRDAAVVGVDDISLCQYVTPALTTVRQPVHRIAEAAVAQLMDQVGLPPRQEPLAPIVFPPTLVVRGSTAPRWDDR